RLVAFVGRRLVDQPFLLVVTAREEELADVPTLRQAFADPRRESRLTTLALGPLSREDTQRLVRVIGPSGDEVALDRLADHVGAASAWNPFGAVETGGAHAEGQWVAS